MRARFPCGVFRAWPVPLLALAGGCGSDDHVRVVGGQHPQPVFLEVAGQRDDLAPCIGAEPCSLPNFVDFTVRFTATPFQGSRTGFQWKLQRFGRTEPWWPFGDDRFLEGGRDTLMLSEDTGDPLWRLDDGVVTVYYTNQRPYRAGAPIAPGMLEFKTRTRDLAAVDDSVTTAERQIVVNLAPDTRLARIPACDCPNPAPNCTDLGTVPVGWISKIGSTEFPIDEWIPFCEGDTVPKQSQVRFFAEGWDDPRDEPIDPEAGFQDARMKFRYTIPGLDETSPFSASWPSQELALPNGEFLRGASAGWTPCPLEYVVYAAAVDEHGLLDPTPPSLRFAVGFPPTIDSVRVADVLVFVPSCPAPYALCGSESQHVFGPDTLAVSGTHIADDPSDGYQTSLGLGYNRFVIPLMAWGRDTRAWRFRFDCASSTCEDLNVPGEGGWTSDDVRPDDPPNQHVFFKNITIVAPLDTFCVGRPCTAMRIRVDFPYAGDFDFEIEGRDTFNFWDRCSMENDLGPQPTNIVINISEFGHQSPPVLHRTHWRQLADVRPPAKAFRVGALSRTPKRLQQ